MGEAKRKARGMPPEPPIFPFKLPAPIQFALMRERLDDVAHRGGKPMNIVAAQEAE